MTYRLTRNIPYEKYVLGHPEPFAPRYDVEELDADTGRIPVRVHAVGARAEAARALIERLEARSRLASARSL